MTRTQRKGVALHSILITALAAAVLTGAAISGMTHDAPIAGYVGRRAPRKPVNVPEWDDAEHAGDYAGCTETLPAGQIPSSVVVVRLSGEVTRMDFDEAWQRTHDLNAANDVWVVGQCA